VLIGQDESDAAGTAHFLNAGDIHAALSKSIDQLRTERILAHFADHGYGISKLGGSDSLISPFAAEKSAERIANHGFTRGRQVRRSGDKIQVNAANDNNWFRHTVSQGFSGQ
jgi:hypothetical protein